MQRTITIRLTGVHKEKAMCGGGGPSVPQVPQVRQFQSRQAPVFRDQVAKRRGRRGTNLTENTQTVTDENRGEKKTLLGS